MNIGTGNFNIADSSAVSFHGRASVAHLPQAFFVRLADTVTAITFDSAPGEPGSAHSRLSALVDGTPLAKPMLSSSHDLRSGGRRQVLLLRRSVESLTDHTLTLLLGGHPAAVVDPLSLQPPVVDGLSLIEGLSEQGQRRLLKLLLTTGASMFGLDVSADVGATVRSLLDQLGVTTADFVASVPIGNVGRILSFHVPDHWKDPNIVEIVAQQSTRLSRVAKFDLRLEASRHGSLCHVFLHGTAHRDVTLFGLGDKPVVFPLPEGGCAQKPLFPWLQGRDGETGQWVRELVETAAREDGMAAALQREIRPGADVNLTLRHLSRTPTGLLYAFEVEDRQELLRAVRVERSAQSVDLALPEGNQRTAAVQRIAGYAELPDFSPYDSSVRVSLVYRSGRIRKVESLLPINFDGCVPGGLGRFDHDQTAVSVARARREMVRPMPAFTITEFGKPSEFPSIDVVCAVGSNLDIIRARTAMLARERNSARVHSIYYVVDGPEADAARAAVAGAHAIFGVPFTLLTVAVGANSTELMRVALSQVRADLALVLGPDVLPQTPGWLMRWTRALGRASAPQILGGTLLSTEAVMDAGGTFCPGQPMVSGKRFDGVPECDLPKASTMITDLVTVECVGLNGNAIDLVCSSENIYPNPDIFLAAVVEKIRREGGRARTFLRGRFIRYCDDRTDDAIGALADHHELIAIHGEAQV